MLRIIIEIDGGKASVRAGEGQERTGVAALTGGAALTAVPETPSAAYGAATNAGRAPLGPSAPGAMSAAEGPLPLIEMVTTPLGTGEESAGAAPAG